MAVRFLVRSFSKIKNMVFACQRDSFQKEFKTKVVSCKEGKLGKQNGFEVILEDTILFPEGGGQPDDRGKINDVDVLRVTRQKGNAVHFLSSAVPEGTEVNVVVDWTRRFDHMQQHSGQHLLSALIENQFGYETTSWDLGINKSHIELKCSKLSLEEIEWIERTANESIRKKIPVNLHIYSNPSSEELKHATTRGLPDDHVGAVRVIEIEGIDRNMCCGTHVQNLSQIQVIKLFPDTESMRGGVRLFFLCGDRVMKYLGKCINNEKAFTKLLSCGPDDHSAAVERVYAALKGGNKTVKSLLREVAQLEAYKLKATKSGQSYFCVHRENGDMDYMNTIINELSDQNVPILVTVGPDKGQGQFVLIGPEKQVNEVGPKIASALEGKGGGKKGRYQGKANCLKGRKAAEELLKEYTTSDSTDTS